MADVTVEIVESIASIETTDDKVTVDLGTSGPQGPKGDKGDNGEVLYEDLSYVHTQSIASNTWTITHGLQFIPSITVVDSAGTVVEGSYNYPDANTVVASFSGAFSGKAYLS
jgi:hypothetical protein